MGYKTQWRKIFEQSKFKDTLSTCDDAKIVIDEVEAWTYILQYSLSVSNLEDVTFETCYLDTWENL